MCRGAEEMARWGESACYSGRGPKFSSQHQRKSSRTSVTPVPCDDSVFLSGLHGHQTHKNKNKYVLFKRLMYLFYVCEHTVAVQVAVSLHVVVGN